MTTYDLNDAEGRLYAFEVDSAIGRSAVPDAVRSISGAEVLESHTTWFGPDEFCRFRIGGVEFCAYEPYGDNSRYWIGPKPPHPCPETRLVRDAFRVYIHVERVSMLTGLVMLGGGLTTAVVWLGVSGEPRLGGLAAALFLVGFVQTGRAWRQRREGAKT